MRPMPCRTSFRGGGLLLGRESAMHALGMLWPALELGAGAVDRCTVERAYATAELGSVLCEGRDVIPYLLPE